jgi:hypothetical protein
MSQCLKAKATNAHRGSRGLALLFNLDTRWVWVVNTAPQPPLPTANNATNVRRVHLSARRVRLHIFTSKLLMWMFKCRKNLSDILSHIAGRDRMCVRCVTEFQHKGQLQNTCYHSLCCVPMWLCTLQFSLQPENAAFFHACLQNSSVGAQSSPSRSRIRHTSGGKWSMKS